MNTRKIAITAAIGTITALTYSLDSSANSYNYSSNSSFNTSFSSSNAGAIHGPYGNFNPTSPNRFNPNRSLYGASETATFYYKVGVKQFEKGNLDKAERAFNSVLRADGLNKQAYHYLALINLKQGNKEAAQKYTLSLNKLVERK